MRRVDHAPAPIEPHVVDEPRYRTRSQSRETFVNFAQLLGRMDVDRPWRHRFANAAKNFGRHRAQRMWGKADARMRQGRDDCAGAIEELQKSLRIVDAAPLGFGGRLTAESAEG